MFLIGIQFRIPGRIKLLTAKERPAWAPQKSRNNADKLMRKRVNYSARKTFGKGRGGIIVFGLPKGEIQGGDS